MRSLGCPLHQRIACGLALLGGLLGGSSPFSGQRSQQALNPPPWPFTNPDAEHGRVTAPELGMQPSEASSGESCSLWDAPEVKRSAVSASRLQVPPKAKGEYTKACTDVRHKKLASAENHLHNAVQQYQSYADAWVLLGQVLEAGNHVGQAQTACSEATRADSNYTPGYLCLADVAGQQKQWNQTLDMANRALAIASQDVYGYFYTAMAEFHLNQFAEAESNALQTINADHSHRVPQVHLLLAQIYGSKHDLHNAAAQLRVYLKVAPDSANAPQVRASLAQLETQIAK